jgi:Uma2 family endonuclease
MTPSQSTPQLLTAADYLTYNDGTDDRYELVNGILTEMPPESNLNVRIAFFLLTQFLNLLPFTRLCHKDAELQVTSIKASFRIPDLMVLSEAGEAALAGSSRNTITLDMPAPLLVIEVVPPDDAARDYRFKRSEYAVRGVPEYWIVDPAQKQVLILTLVEGFYDEAICKGDQPLASPTFPTLTLTPDQIFFDAP